jgi:hypothetical protein
MLSAFLYIRSLKAKQGLSVTPCCSHIIRQKRELMSPSCRCMECSCSLLLLLLLLLLTAVELSLGVSGPLHWYRQNKGKKYQN